MGDTRKGSMNRLGPYLLALAGIALAGADTLHVSVLPASASEGWGSILGVLLSSLGWIWSHRSLSKNLGATAATAAKNVDVEEIAAAAVAAAAAKMHEPGSHLSGIIADAAKAAAVDAGEQLVQHVRESIAGSPDNAPVPRLPREAIEEIAFPTPAGSVGGVSSAPPSSSVVGG